jgi:phosphoadenosine phosphosulfate reductase
MPSSAATISPWEREDIAMHSQTLEGLSPVERVEWAFKHLPQQAIVSSSFGAQSAVMLHLINTVAPNTPVVLTDTGYLFAETYQFIDTLTEQLQLNLKVYRAEHSAAWQEARYGKLWEDGLEGLNRYNQMNKVEPMQRALTELNVGTWFAGLRRSQSQGRSQLPVLQDIGQQIKVYPIIDQSNKQLHEYLKAHNLSYHPLWEQGYVSIGDWHSTRALSEGMSEEETRFGGLKRECGLHEFGDGI